MTTTTRRSPRYRLEEISEHQVVLHRADWITGDPTATEYWAPSSGGYVREITDSRPGTLGQQVCEGLSHRGVTLYWSGKRPLIHLIRAQVRRALREEQRAREA